MHFGRRHEVGGHVRHAEHDVIPADRCRDRFGIPQSVLQGKGECFRPYQMRNLLHRRGGVNTLGENDHHAGDIAQGLGGACLDRHVARAAIIDDRQSGGIQGVDPRLVDIDQCDGGTGLDQPGGEIAAHRARTEHQDISDQICVLPPNWNTTPK